MRHWCEIRGFSHLNPEQPLPKKERQEKKRRVIYDDHNDKKKHMLPENNHVPIQTLEHDHAETPPVTRERVSVPWRRKENAMSVSQCHDEPSAQHKCHQEPKSEQEPSWEKEWEFELAVWDQKEK